MLPFKQLWGFGFRRGASRSHGQFFWSWFWVMTVAVEGWLASFRELVFLRHLWRWSLRRSSGGSCMWSSILSHTAGWAAPLRCRPECLVPQSWGKPTSRAEVVVCVLLPWRTVGSQGNWSDLILEFGPIYWDIWRRNQHSFTERWLVEDLDPVDVKSQSWQLVCGCNSSSWWQVDCQSCTWIWTLQADGFL